MDGDGTVHPACKARRPSAHHPHARSSERHTLNRSERLRVAACAGLDGAPLFLCLRDAGLFDAINMALVMSLRKSRGATLPSAGVIDSQSGKTTESGGVCGYGAGKKIKGHKRHIFSDTYGFLVLILVHAADIQDRGGAVDVLEAIRQRLPWLRLVFADGGYSGRKLSDAIACHGDWPIDIIKRSDAAKGFEILPRR